MSPTQDFFNQVDNRVRVALQVLRPMLLEGHGTIEHELKDDKSVVTTMDLLVERRLQTILASIDPSIGFCGEETGVDYTQKTFWLVDPIDGTESFIRGLPFSSTMVVLIHDNQPIMSIIYNFFLDEYYLAVKGQGATMNGHRIHVSDRPLDSSFVAFRGHGGKLDELSASLRPHVMGMPKMQTSGYEFSAVARGALDGCISWHSNDHLWDFAPGALLIQEAGGRVENLNTTGYDYRNSQFIAANPVIFEQLKEYMLKNGALSTQ